MNLDEKLQRFNATQPLENASTIPGDWYFDPEIYERELKNVFGKGWHYIGFANDLSSPGSYISGRIGRDPVLVTRDKVGQLHALSNVCRHRGTVLLPNARGQISSISCRYHGWNYGLDGCLKSAPQFEGVANFDFSKNGLPKLRADILGPFIFATLDAGSPPISALASDWNKRMPESMFKNLEFHSTVSYDIECNWKVFVDNYLDGGYHIGTLHKGLASVLNDAEYQNEIFDLSSLQSVPLKKATDATVTSVRQGDKAYYWWMYPNFMVNVYDGVMDTNFVEPLGPEKCRVLFSYYFNRKDFSEERIQNSIEVAHRVQLEDQEISQSVQQGLRSSLYSTGRFSVKREGTGLHFQRLLATSLRS